MIIIIIITIYSQNFTDLSLPCKVPECIPYVACKLNSSSYFYQIVVVIIDLGTLKLKYCYRIQILDCYTDPLGWKEKLVEPGNNVRISNEASIGVCLCKTVTDMHKLLSSIIELGKGMVVYYRSIPVHLRSCFSEVIFHLLSFLSRVRK